MEANILVYIFGGLLLIFVVLSTISWLRTKRSAELMQFCQLGTNPNCGERINRVNLKRLEIQRFTLCLYFYKFIEAGDVDKLNQLYLSLQIVENFKKKKLCDSTFAQAVSTAKSYYLVKAVADGLIKSANDPKLAVTDVLIAIIANLTTEKRAVLFLEICDRLHEFKVDIPERDGFVHLTLLKLKKALKV